MSGRKASPVKKKYSARALSAGSAFCPACKKLTDREAPVCPACGFAGEHTMSIFSVSPPPLEVVADYAKLFKPGDEAKILKAIRGMRRAFPQIHWNVVTVNLPPEDDISLFSFWLLNVSPPGTAQELKDRPWTVLLVLQANGDVAVVPGYAAEVWLSGETWSRLMRSMARRIPRDGYGDAIAEFMKQGEIYLQNSWQKAINRTRRSKLLSHFRER